MTLHIHKSKSDLSRSCFRAASDCPPLHSTWPQVISPPSHAISPSLVLTLIFPSANNGGERATAAWVRQGQSPEPVFLCEWDPRSKISMKSNSKCDRNFITNDKNSLTFQYSLKVPQEFTHLQNISYKSIIKKKLRSVHNPLNSNCFYMWAHAIAVVHACHTWALQSICSSSKIVTITTNRVTFYFFAVSHAILPKPGFALYQKPKWIQKTQLAIS